MSSPSNSFSLPVPCMKAPPCIQNITGSFASGAALSGVQTFRYRQSSLRAGMGWS